jgi:hypothetical protein
MRFITYLTFIGFKSCVTLPPVVQAKQIYLEFSFQEIYYQHSVAMHILNLIREQNPKFMEAISLLNVTANQYDSSKWCF